MTDNKNQKVEVLDLAYNNINGGVPQLFQAFSSFTHGLTIVNLENCNINSKQMVFFFMALTKNYPASLTLEYLNIGGNQIDDEGSFILGDWLGTPRSYQSIRFLSVARTGVLFEPLFKGIRLTEHIEEIDASGVWLNMFFNF